MGIISLLIILLLLFYCLISSNNKKKLTLEEMTDLNKESVESFNKKHGKD
jgi:hypothetical protein